LIVIRQIVVLLFISQVIGCSSIRTFAGEDSEHFRSAAYSGVRLNGAYWACVHQMEHLKEAPLWEVSLNTLAYSFYYLPDLILSFVVDTISLPYDVYSKLSTEEERFPAIECEGLAPYYG
jgi:uncharacterized protein YceK